MRSWRISIRLKHILSDARERNFLKILMHLTYQPQLFISCLKSKPQYQLGSFLSLCVIVMHIKLILLSEFQAIKALCQPERREKILLEGDSKVKKISLYFQLNVRSVNFYCNCKCRNCFLN